MKDDESSLAKNEITKGNLNLSDVIDKIIKDLKSICNRNSEEDPMKLIIDLVNKSKNDENLSNMSLPWNPWF